MNKLIVRLIPILAAGALIAVPATAQAESNLHWYGHGSLIPTGEDVPIVGHGHLTFHLSEIEAGVTCRVRANGTVMNPPEGAPGTGEITEFETSHCYVYPKSLPFCPGHSQVTVGARGLPWGTHLVHGLVVPKSEIDGIALLLQCSGTLEPYAFAGSLAPAVGTGGLEFGESAGYLLGEPPVVVTGTERLTGPSGLRSITAR